MDNQVVRRRMSMIASHLGSHEDISATAPATATATHLFPMSCSNTLNSVIRRCDNIMHFARQSSSSQACFMRQVSNDQSRGQGSYAQSTMPSKPTGCANKGLYTYEAPVFSKPSRMEPSLQNVVELQWLQQACNYHQLVPDPPTFARPSSTNPHYHITERKEASNINGFPWLPKMDIAESGRDYVITLELPGVSISKIKVAVNNQNLRVTGYHSIEWRKAANCSIDSISAYHKREISQGPYEIVWPLPINVKKDSISAEFVEGLLLITVPKLSEASRQLKKPCM